MDLEIFREIFKDNRLHISVGKILKTSLVSDKSVLRANVSIWPEQREIIADCAWESVGPGAGFYQFPVPGDLVLVAYADGDDDQAFVFRRLSSKEDSIPANAVGGNTVLKSLADKILWLTGQGNLYLSKGDTVPTENLVLGQELKTLLVDILTQLSDLSLKISTHTHIGNLGYPVSAPNEAADFITIQGEFDNLKASPVEDEVILSDFAFTEKGS